MSFLLFEIGRTQILSAIQRGNQCRIGLLPSGNKRHQVIRVPYPQRSTNPHDKTNERIIQNKRPHGTEHIEQQMTHRCPFRRHIRTNRSQQGSYRRTDITTQNQSGSYVE